MASRPANQAVPGLPGVSLGDMFKMGEKRGGKGLWK